MIRCPQCDTEISEPGKACPKCGHWAHDPEFLAGLPAPDEPLEEVEGWSVILATSSESEARLACGFLETAGFKALVQPELTPTGFERLGQPGVFESMLGGAHDVRASMPFRVLVEGEDSAQEALRMLRELRERPFDLRDDEDEGVSGEGSIVEASVEEGSAEEAPPRQGPVGPVDAGSPEGTP